MSTDDVIPVVLILLLLIFFHNFWGSFSQVVYEASWALLQTYFLKNLQQADSENLFMEQVFPR